MRSNLRFRLALFMGLALLGQSAGHPQGLQVWHRGIAGVQVDPDLGDVPLAVGSIQKPFVAKAWAEAHPGEAAPRIRCGPEPRCWFHAGHGELDLTQALVVSCNVYFRALAEATPRAQLAAELHREGFIFERLTTESAIGLPGVGGLLTIRPSDLLAAYVQLVKAPWPVGEPIRLQVLAGLRAAAVHGTASLSQRGYWAKTGTVPAEDGTAGTRGYAVAVDDTGWAILGRLARGTGSETAAALAEPLNRLRPWNPSRPFVKARKPAPPPGNLPKGPSKASTGRRLVKVQLLDLVPARPWVVTNAGPSPVATSQGYLGPMGSLNLRPGLRLGPGLLELRSPSHGLQRRFEGELACGQGTHKSLTLIATLALREYADGVVAAELPFVVGPRRIELGAAILRFLDQNHRHAAADVCDSTHCAWFIGRGPRLSWQDPTQAQRLATESPRPLTDAEWAAILEAALKPGPSQWSSHCGGTPLSPHRLWGFGDLEAPPCPRHDSGGEFAHTRPWVRVWRSVDLERAFGFPVEALAVVRPQGVWNLQVSGGGRAQSLRYDDAHRALASSLGWGGLPSPAEGIERTPDGFRVWGVGLGHRVGLCLGD